MYNKPNAKPNQKNVAQILDLEFEARRAFIDVDVIKIKIKIKITLFIPEGKFS